MTMKSKPCVCVCVCALITEWERECVSFISEVVQGTQCTLHTQYLWWNRCRIHTHTHTLQYKRTHIYACANACWLFIVHTHTHTNKHKTAHTDIKSSLQTCTHTSNTCSLSLFLSHTHTHTCICQQSRQMHGDRAAVHWINTLSVPHVKLHHCIHEHFRHLSSSSSLSNSLSLWLRLTPQPAVESSSQPVGHPANRQTSSWQSSTHPPAY